MHRFKLAGGQACVLQKPASGGDERVLILVHSPPFEDKDSPLLLHLATSLGFATIRIDLSGCGESTGSTQLASHERDADDIAACVRHCVDVLGLEVAGLVGLGGGGTAALVLAARNTHPTLELLVTVGARASLRGAERAAGLTWSQLDQLKARAALQPCRLRLLPRRFFRLQLSCNPRHVHVHAPRRGGPAAACPGWRHSRGQGQSQPR